MNEISPRPARAAALEALALVRSTPTSGPAPDQIAAHRAELERTQVRRAYPDPERYERERETLLERSAAALGMNTSALPTLAEFPWTSRFDACDHCLEDLRIHLVDVPSDVPAATREHAVELPRPGRPTVVFYSASWIQQRGVHPHAVYEGEPIDYLAFAPTYLRISTRDVRPLFATIPEARVLTLVVPVVSEPERKLTEYALNELAGFCHPALHAAFDAIFVPRIQRADGRALSASEVVESFSKLVLVGYSSGCTAVLQHVNRIRTVLAAAGFPPSVAAAALRRVLCVFIAPNVHYERWTDVRKIAARSPLDAVVTGHSELGLFSTVTDDRALDGFSEADVARLARGELEAVRTPPAISLDPMTVQINLPLPGIVRFAEDGTRLHPFRDGKNGHDSKPYLRKLERHPGLIEAVRRTLSGAPDPDLELRRYDLRLP